MTAKDHVKGLLDRLPNESTLEDIQYHLHVYRKIQRGLEDIENGNVIPHEEVVRRMKAKWSKD